MQFMLPAPATYSCLQGAVARNPRRFWNLGGAPARPKDGSNILLATAARNQSQLQMANGHHQFSTRTPCEKTVEIWNILSHSI
jgi:hypothetical protein